MTLFPHPVNYRGQSFAGKNLSGRDFSYADIRGADFRNATLHNANFIHSKAGIPPTWNLTFLLIVIVLTLVSGYIIGFSSALPAFISSLVTDEGSLTSVGLALVTIGILVTFSIVTIRRGIGAALGIYTIVCVALFVIVSALGSGEGVFAASVVLLLALAGAASGLLLAALVTVLGQELLGNLPSVNLLLVVLVLIGAVLGFLEGSDIANNQSLYSIPELVACVVLLLILVGLSIFMGRNASDQDSRYALFHQYVVNCLTSRGTCFKEANLINADFSNAVLKQTDLRNTTLIGANFSQSKGLTKSRLSGTYLQNRKILNLVVSGQGQGQTYDGLNLSGVNLKSAKLTDASFIGTNLSESNLKNADLSRSKLVQAQLYRSNLSGAVLTGAYIENWGISIETQLDKVRCSYIYMHLPTREDPDPCRKPDNRREVFQPGDFTIFITPIIKTLDLYQQQNVDPRRIAETYKTVDLFHHEGIDPGAAAIALKQLAEQHPEAGLEVVALEGRGEDKIRLQARVSREADRSQLSVDYFEKYNEAAALPYGDLQSLLAAIDEKDKRIRSLENMVATAMQSDKFYVETYYDLGKSAEDSQPVRRILILAANPRSVERNRLDAEVRAIQTGLERAKKREQFEIISKWAVRTEDLRRALLDYEPHIVQFSGVGIDNQGLAFEGDTGEVQLVATSALASLFEIFKDKVECVFLNACYSAQQTDAISQHIPYVIGMNQAIGERAALEFAVGFYDAVGAGRSIEDAFKVGCISIDLEGLPESLLPVLKKRD